MVNVAFLENTMLYMELSIPQFLWKGVCFVVHMPKMQAV